MQSSVLRSALHLAARSAAPTHRRALSTALSSADVAHVGNVVGDTEPFAGVEPPPIPRRLFRLWPAVDDAMSAKIVTLHREERYEDVVASFIEMDPGAKRSLNDAGHAALLGALNALQRYTEGAEYMRSLKIVYKDTLWCEDRRNIAIEGLQSYVALKRAKRALDVLAGCQASGALSLEAEHYFQALECNRSEHGNDKPVFPANTIEHSVATARLMAAEGFVLPPALWKDLVASCLAYARFDDAAFLLNVYTKSATLPGASLVPGLLMPVRYHQPSLAVAAFVQYAAHPALASDAAALHAAAEAVLAALMNQPASTLEDVTTVLGYLQRISPTLLHVHVLPYLLRSMPAADFLALVAKSTTIRLTSAVFARAFKEYARKKDAASCETLVDYAVEHELELTWEAVEALMKLHADARAFASVFELAQLAFGGKSKADVAHAPRAVFRLVVEATIELGQFEDTVLFCDKYLVDNGDEFSQSMRLVATMARRLTCVE
ncbi:hypothetical protein ACHHYP_08784 [Achlya hypogyna]|uniref:Pentacotripeptide-repeat region of PRORP domain-containing protein n=1 Tax=Achlya hypogyna TaxID=1202772 RepID=A0A1V9YPB9_ACHHY|nr:hypothetical protein ACHHYP_08784 [Achlya hypogyna]